MEFLQKQGIRSCKKCMKMIRRMLIMISLALFVLPAMILATEMETSCTVFFNDGQVIHAERFIRFLDESSHDTRTYKSYSISSSLGFVRTLKAKLSR